MEPMETEFSAKAFSKKYLLSAFSFSLLMSESQKPGSSSKVLPELGTVWYSCWGPAVVLHPPFPPSQGVQTLLHTGLKG